MRKVYLICPYIEGLATIKSYLEELSLEISDFLTLESALKEKELPDLIILFAQKTPADFTRDLDALKASAPSTRIPRIFIFPSNFPDSVERAYILDGRATFHIPVDRLRFMAVVSKFLNRALRRVFRILITLQPEGTNIRYSGVSMDFSETGMAFESASDLAQGEKLTIHFVNPRNRKRFVLKSEIARKAKSPASDNTFYGVKFLNPSTGDKKDLISFITGEE